MKITRLRGWNVGVEKAQAPGEDDEWRLTFTEKLPPTGDAIIFEMNRDTRDALVRALTDGIVLAGGELPKL
jgi:hypothetical protein